MSKIFIGFSYPHKFKIGAAAIAWWLSTPYSHVYIRFESETMPSSVYHAAHGMVHFISYARFKEQNKCVHEYEVAVTTTQRRQALIQCMELAGIEYSTTELVNILMTDLCNSFGHKLSTTNSKGYICSELVGEFLIQLGATFNKPTHLLTPLDIKQGLTTWQESLLYRT